MLSGPTALLHRWYSLVREKRATRQDFLKSLVKVFDVEMNKSTQVHNCCVILAYAHVFLGRCRLWPLYGREFCHV